MGEIECYDYLAFAKEGNLVVMLGLQPAKKKQTFTNLLVTSHLKIVKHVDTLEETYFVVFTVDALTRKLTKCTCLIKNKKKYTILETWVL